MVYYCLHFVEDLQALADSLAVVLLRLPADQGVVAQPEPLLLLVRHEELVELLPPELQFVLSVLGQGLLVCDRVVLPGPINFFKGHSHKTLMC